MQTEYIWSGKVYVHVECKMSCKMSWNVCSGKIYDQRSNIYSDTLLIEVKFIFNVTIAEAARDVL